MLSGHPNTMITTQQAKDKSLRSVEWLARGSYVAKAIFYATIALFTFTLTVRCVC